MSTDGVVSKKARVEREARTEVKEERRTWEEMDMNCLANAFSKAGMESLLLSLPFVCKSWYEATLSPLCWTSLSFPDYRPSPLFVNTVEEIETIPRSFGLFYDKFVDEYGIDRSRFLITTFVKVVVDRSKGKATQLKLPPYCTEAALRYVSDACPLLKEFSFEDDLVMFKHSQILPELIGKWKFLEILCLEPNFMLFAEFVSSRKYFSKYFLELLAPESPNCYNVLERIVVQIGTHCKNFRGLHLAHYHLPPAEALAIANFLPHLQTMLACRCIIERDSLLTIVRGCKELLIFYAKECAGFEEDAEAIYKLARQTGKVVCQDCALHNELLNLLGNELPALLRTFVFTRLNVRD